ncbi:MAG TPA: RluA family pseudouridine synthase [Verrucomicrobiae bacterium]|nr:RluA family pseudouridine synthase [Verrucomicrobiae bacterium]
MNPPLKLSWPDPREFWEVPVLFEDAQLLALDKPAGLLASPDRLAPDRPSLMRLLHQAIADRKPWTVERGLTYLSNAHRLDAETTGVFLLAKSKAVLIALADLFGSRKPLQQYLALVHGSPAQDQFQINSRLAAQPDASGVVRVDPRNGKRSETRFTVLERFASQTLLRCELLTNRPHQIRAHLHNAGLRVVGDALYGGKPLWLSRLKRDYRLKPGREERPLIARTALHAEQLALPHPVTGESLTITSPMPKDLRVALKYLREYSGGQRCKLRLP